MDPLWIIAAFVFGVIVAIIFLDLYSPWFYIWSFLGMSLRIAYEKDLEYQAENADAAPMPALRQQVDLF